jgi:hypothetical protein
MAIAKQITNEKGVISRYHKIHKVEILGDKIKMTVRNYVNQDMRDAEKTAQKNNEKAQAQQLQIYELRQRLEELMAKNTEHDFDAEVKDVSEKINAAEANQLQFTPVVDKFAEEVEEEIAYFEPFTMAAAYGRLIELEKYKDGKEI